MQATASTMNINGTVGDATPTTGKFTTLTASSLTSGRVPIVSTAGLLADDADLTFSGTRLTVTDLTATGQIYGSSATSTGTAVFRSGFNGTSEACIDLADLDNQSGVSFLVFRKADSTAIGSITRNAATDAVLYTTTSDGTLKTITGPVSPALVKAAIEAIVVTDFNWKSDGSRGIGPIAQQLAAAHPVLLEIGIVTPGDPVPVDYATESSRLTRKLGRALAFNAAEKAYKQAARAAKTADEVAAIPVPVLEVQPEDAAPAYKPWQVNFTGLVPFLINYAQQQNARLDTIEARLAALEV